MAFAQWKTQNTPVVTVTIATVVTLDEKMGQKSDTDLPSVTKVTSVTVTESENQKKSEPISKIELLPKSPVFGGGDSVILANSENLTVVDNLPTVAANDYLRLDRYAHCVTCNQCEYLSLTGSCSRLGKRVLPQALRECDSFNPLKSERISPVEAKPYTHAELERLVNQAAKPLYFHLIDCEQCNLEDMRYCVDCFTTGNTFDCLLLCFDDAANKRYLLMNQVIKARVSRRREFVPLSSDNAPPTNKCTYSAKIWQYNRV